MAHEFRMTRRVEFADTDMAGITHFTHFFRFMEETEHAFFRSLGLSIVTRRGRETISWPRAAVSCAFSKPVFFEDELTVHLRVTKKGRTSLTYDFTFYREEDEVARGQMTAVCCSIQEGEKMRAIRLPTEIVERIEAAPEASDEGDGSRCSRRP